MWRVAVFTALAAAAGGPAQAYYHFVHYLNGGNAPEKFDLNALSGNTVTFLVSESGPAVYAGTDTFNSVLSQIQQAANIWNNVGSSDLRVAFGGFEAAGTLQSTPGGDVVFEDLPPGVEGFGGPTSLNSATVAAGGDSFFPIARAVVHLSRNLALAPGPSYSQDFLMTTLHEMGHALGLQHTFTSATMSQDTTRATTLTHPLDNDDIAGISVLYPNAAFGGYGTITGRITKGGAGVHLASVVAIKSGAGAISAVTNRDGSFRIAGVPAGQYAVYVHTMPPDANIEGPWNADGSAAAATGAVNAVFYAGANRGTMDYAQAAPVPAGAGVITSGIDIDVTGRASVPYFDGQLFGYLNNNTVAVRPAPVTIGGGITALAAAVTGLGSSGKVPGLGVQIPGGAISIVPNGILPVLVNGATDVYLYLTVNPGAQPGPQHIIFSTPDYMYVLPSAMYLTLTGPPLVTGAGGNGDGTATVTGTNLRADSLIYFDALPSTILSLDTASGVAVVAPPAGANGQQSVVTIYNTDGQNSQFLQSANPVRYSYGASQAPAITSIFPSALPAGSEAMVDILGDGFPFVQGLTSAGFGSSDIRVRGVFVLAPDHMQVNVSVSPRAAPSIEDVSVVTGFRVATIRPGLQITPAVAGLPVVAPVLVNALTGLTGSYPGAIVSLYGTNLAVPGASPGIIIGGVPVTILYASPGQINLQVPAQVPPGPAVLYLNNGQMNAYPVTVNIDPAPAGFAAVQNSSGAYIDSVSAAEPGDTLIATMNNFAPPESRIDLKRVQVSLGGVLHAPLAIREAGSFWQIFFALGAGDATGTAEQLIVYLDGRSSYPATIPVGALAGS